MNEKIFVIGTRNKKGIIKKTKWCPNSVVISMKEYQEYLELKTKKEKEEAIKEVEKIKALLKL